MEADLAVGLDILKRIQNTRKDLLDLSARNRLISSPRATSSGRKVDIVDERSDEVFRLLVRERKSMSFLPGAAAAEEPASDDPAAPYEDFGIAFPDVPEMEDISPTAYFDAVTFGPRLSSFQESRRNHELALKSGERPRDIARSGFYLSPD
jgi:hypothetical protein